MNRIDRIPYLLDRWSGPISICIVLSEQDVLNIDRIIDPFKNRSITFTFYIAKTSANGTHTASYIRDKDNGIIHQFSKMIYPVNLARNLAIESISTTHYLWIDCDFFISSTLYMDITSLSHIISKPDVILVLPTFQVHTRILYKCRQYSNCKTLY